MDSDDRSRARKVIPLGVGRAEAPPPGDSDDALMELVAAGSLAHYGRLVQRHQARLRAYCTACCGDRAAGDDLAQEALLDLWRARRQYRGLGRFAAYLFALARNRCHTARRRQPTAPAPVVAPPDGAACDATQLDEMLAAERRRRLDQALASLPAKLRETVLLRFRAELEYPDIARLLGKPEATIRSRVFLGIKRLRRALKGVDE